MKTKLLTICILFLSSPVFSVEYGFIKGDGAIEKEDMSSIVSFSYDKPVKGIKIHGTFEANDDWHRGGWFDGKLKLFFERVSDGKSFVLEREPVSFFTDEICIPPSNYDLGCNFINNRIVQYSDTENFTDMSPIKFVDFDFDGDIEIILMRAHGVRHGPEFEAYELINNDKEFYISQEQLVLTEYGKNCNACYS